MSGVDLSHANLQGVNFESANLTNAKLNHSILRCSNMTKANLTNTVLIGANLCGVDLQQAHLEGTKLKSIVSDRHTQLTSDNSNANHNLPVAVKQIVLESNITAPTPEQLQQTRKNRWSPLIIVIMALIAERAI
ncbi:MAG: pentapeptide repeat-containing protein [Cyanobacteria bacterium J06558_2]